MRSISRQTRALTAAVFLTMTGLALVAPILPLYAREFGVSRTAAGALISSFAAARLAFDIVGGVTSDRIGARRVMLWGAALISVSSVGAALAPNYGLLLLTRILEGFGSAAFATAAMKLIVVTTPRERLGRTMAFYQTGLLAGLALGPVVGGLAAELGDFATPFWVYAGLGLGIAGLVWRYVDPVDAPATSVADIYRAAGALLRTPAFAALLFVTFAIFVMRAGARLTLLPLYGGEELGLSESQIGLVLAAGALVTLAVVNPTGWLVDKVGRVPILIVGLLTTAVTVGAHGFATSFVELALVSMAFGVTAALMGIPPPTLAGDLAPPGAEGAAVGLYRMAGDVGLVVGPLLLAGISEGGSFGAGFMVSGALLVVAAGVAATIGRRRRGTTAEPAPPVGVGLS